MDGDLVNPGELHGFVLQAGEVALSWDENLISAVVGPNLVEGFYPALGKRFMMRGGKLRTTYSLRLFGLLRSGYAISRRCTPARVWNIAC